MRTVWKTLLRREQRRIKKFMRKWGKQTRYCETDIKNYLNRHSGLVVGRVG